MIYSHLWLFLNITDLKTAKTLENISDTEVVCGCFADYVLLKISKNSQENACG